MCHRIAKFIVLAALLCLTACPLAKKQDPSQQGPSDPNAPIDVEQLKKKGNAEGYGVRSFVVEKNTRLNFVLDEQAASNADRSYRIVTAPANGTLTGTFAGNVSGGGSGLYAPGTNYIGLDSFTYQILEEGKTTTVKAFVDVRPCFRIPVERPNATNLHVVASKSANSGETIAVVVKKSDEPITLLLVSYFTVTWNLEIEEGAVIDKVVLQKPYGTGSAGSSITNVPQGTQVIQRHWEKTPHFSEKWEPGSSLTLDTSFAQMIEEIRNYFGKNETSFQGCYGVKRAVIPFTPESLAATCNTGNPSHYTFANQSCNERCGPPVSSPSFTAFNPATSAPGLIFSNGNLTVSTVPGLQGAARIAEGRTCGRYYYEISTDAVANTYLRGIGFARGGQDPALGLLDLAPYFNYPPRIMIDFSQGDVIGVALDLDNGRAYFSRNGNWINGGNPAEGTGGTPMGLFVYEPIFPAVQLFYPTIFTFKTQATMSYPAPAGFTPAYQPPPAPLAMPQPGPAKPKRDARPCFRLSQSRPNASNAHVIAVYRGVEAAGNPQGIVEVELEPTSDPLTLVLSAYSQVTWKLKLNGPVTFDKIVLQGYYIDDMQIENLPAGVPVVRRNYADSKGTPYQWQPDETEYSNAFPEFIESVRSLFGKNETSFQGLYTGTKFRIPYTASSNESLYNQPEYFPSSYHFNDQSCIERCQEDGLFATDTYWNPDERSAPHTIAVTNQKLTAYVPSYETQSSAMRANQAKACGKRYYEITTSGSSSVGGYIGFSRASTNFRRLLFTPMLLPTGGYNPLGYNFSGSNVIGVALDLDAGKVYFSRNGSWVVGNPATETGGTTLPLWLVEAMHPAIGLSPGATATANFGATPFQYTVPVGYESGF